MLITATGNLAAGSIVLLGLAGFYMAATVWSIRATWIAVATVSFVLLAPVGLFVLDRRIHAIAAQARMAPDGPVPEALALRTHDPLFAMGLSVDITSLVGIVCLMTNKPPLTSSIDVMVVALALGLALGIWQAARARRSPVQQPMHLEGGGGARHHP